MTLSLHTPLDERFSDIAEVIHVFYPDAKVVPAPKDAYDMLHEHAQESWSADVHLAGRTFRGRRASRATHGSKSAASSAGSTVLLHAAPGHRRNHPGKLTGIRPTRLFYSA